MRTRARITRSHASLARVLQHVVLHAPFGMMLGMLSALGVVSATAAAQDRETNFVAPTNRTVTTRIDESFGDRPYQMIWIRNGSTVPIFVYSVTLRNCENIKQDCDPYPLKLRVRPGDRELLRRVEPKDVKKSFSFSYTFGWRADSASMAALHVLADNGVSKAKLMLDAQNAAIAAQNAAVGVHDVDLDSADMAALGAKLVSIRVEPDTMILHIGQLFPLRQIRVLAIGPQGELLGRAWGYNFRFSGNAVTMRADTIVAQNAGLTTVEFRLAPPAEALSAKVPVIVLAADTTKQDQ